MDRKKKKQAAIKSAANVEQARKALKERFMDRIKKIITLIGGPELLAKFPPIFIHNLYEVRYPVLKIKAAPGSEMSKIKITQFNKLMYQLMEGIDIEFENGNTIPLTWYLSEGLTLMDCVGEINVLTDPDLSEIKTHFLPYLHDSKAHRDLQDGLVQIVTHTCRLLADYNDQIYSADLSDTPYFARFNPQNDILIHPFKQERHQIMLKDGVRTAIRLGWASPDLEMEYYNVKPSLLGFKTPGLDIPLQLYITIHALDRLKERVNITPGVMHEILLLTFLQDKIPHRWSGSESHVDFCIADEKVGYFVVRLHGDKLVVRTFLFLTNNDTFEGEKLGRLLNINKIDKEYLAIDTLPAFNSYHIDQNEKLSKLFRDAGCGSLLKLGYLQEFTANQVKDKDPESILQYLADAPYFIRQLPQDEYEN
ncbi:hypothetical protein [Pedobacter caeni]|uniref:Uncharacterized protein n=1 Tax=Pedobacter caeni TaxID=288992 RepID=A0A1M5F1Q6_9SPHI|nr:hypothetical protein [Pedobacter caeni]SHF85377.1 hypothetical protein SAMN04488522_103896 [Pedobacter caeni]